MAENVDKLTQESETKVTIVLKICEQVVEQLRMYETQLKIAEQQLGPELDTEKQEQGQPLQKQREAPEELRYEAEKLVDNNLGDKAASWQTQYQREKIEVSEGTDSLRGPNEGDPNGVEADTQEEPTIDGAISTHGEANRSLEVLGGDKDRQLHTLWKETNIGKILP